MDDVKLIEYEAEKSACIDLCWLIGGPFIVATAISTLQMLFPQAWPWVSGAPIIIGGWLFYNSRKTHYLNEYTSYKRHIK